MENEIKYKDLNGNVQTVSFDPSSAVVISVESDETEFTVGAESPNLESAVDYIGGRPKRD
jgi:hypothetical protein